MCHGRVYTSSFAGNRLSRTLLAALLVNRIEIPYQAFPERVGRLIDFGTSDYFSGRKNEHLISISKKFEVYW